MPDAHKNFAYSTVATAPSPASSGTSLILAAGDGAKFPAVPFNATVWPAGVNPITTNAEIVRVTAVVTDTLTITRAQEGSSARSVIVGDQIAATITAKTLTDIENLTPNVQSGNYAALVTDTLILASSGITVTLPSAVTVGAGKVFYIKKNDTGTTVVTIATTSSQTIDGETVTALNDPYESLTLVSDGANWAIV